MGKLDSLQDRALRVAERIGDGVRHAVPDDAAKWLQSGAMLGVARTGTRAAGRLVRRNPVASTTALVAAAAIGAGVAYYLLRRRRQDGMVIQGRSRQVLANHIAPGAAAIEESSQEDAGREG